MHTKRIMLFSLVILSMAVLAVSSSQTGVVFDASQKLNSSSSGGDENQGIETELIARDGSYPNFKLLVDANAVVQLSANSSVVIVDTRSELDYLTGHIPGAVNLYFGNLRDDMSRLKPLTEIEKLLTDNGINSSKGVIVYGRQSKKGEAEYLFWALEYLGHRSVAVFDGGMEEWYYAGHENETGEENIRHVEVPFIAAPRSWRIAETSWLNRNIGNSDVQIIDVREKDGEYCGGEPDPPPPHISRRDRGLVLVPPYTGYPGWGYHITGAVNLPYNELYETGDDGAKHMKNVSALKTLLDDLLAADNVLYCHSARRSSYTYFAFRLMGYNARNYDDGMKIWTDVIDTKYRYLVFPCSAECA